MLEIADLKLIFRLDLSKLTKNFVNSRLHSNVHRYEYCISASDDADVAISNGDI